MIQVFDDVLPDFAAYRAATLRLPFETLEPAPGQVFHGIAPTVDVSLLYWIVREVGLTPLVTFVRRSPAGQVEPHWIHTDQDMGEWTGLFYLTDPPAAGDGTTFWRHRRSGRVQSRTDPGTPAWRAEAETWRDLDQWEEETFVGARPNRLVLFDASHFHSRALRDNYGEGDTARLVQVVFGRGALPC